MYVTSTVSVNFIRIFREDGIRFLRFISVNAESALHLDTLTTVSLHCWQFVNCKFARTSIEVAIRIFVTRWKIPLQNASNDGDDCTGYVRE